MTFSNTGYGSRVDFRASFVSRFKGHLKESVEQLFCYGYIKTLRAGKVRECRLTDVGESALSKNRSKLEIAHSRSHSTVLRLCYLFAVSSSGLFLVHVIRSGFPSFSRSLSAEKGP